MAQKKKQGSLSRDVQSLIAARDLGAAERTCRAALKKKPNDTEAMISLGQVYVAAGNLQQAAPIFQAAIDRQPRNITAYLELSAVLAQLGQFQQLFSLNQQAVKQSLEHEFLFFYLGLAKLMVGEAEASIRFFEKALQYNRGNPNTWRNLGKAYTESGYLERGIDAYQQTLDINPQYPDTHEPLAQSLEQENRLEEARTTVDAGLALQPGSIKLLLVDGQLLRREGKTDAAIQRLEQVETNSEGLVRSIAQFELAKIFDKQESFELAWQKLEAANQCMQNLIAESPFDGDIYQATLDELDTTVTTNWAASWNTLILPPHPPLAFLVGFPRSGTTLLDRILSSHPAIQALEETSCMDLVSMQQLEGGESVLQTLPSLDQDQVAALRSVYFDAVNKHIDYDESRLLVDKYPLNITKIPIIRRIFPEAKFILALRHPCDASLSNYMQAYGLNNAMANFFSMDSTVTTYSKVMSLWQRYEELLQPNAHSLHYEKLVVDFEHIVSALIKFLDLEWDDALRNYRDAQSRQTTTPSYSQVVQPLYQNAVQRWLNYREHFEPHLSQLQPFIDSFGYGEAGKIQ